MKKKKFDTVESGWVAMCSNIYLCNFGEYIPGYYATARLDVEEATQKLPKNR